MLEVNQQLLANELHQIFTEGPIDPRQALCWHLGAGGRTTSPHLAEPWRLYRIALYNMMAEWPCSSGDWDYPIPGGCKRYVQTVAGYNGEFFWQGEQGQYRRSLVRYLRDEIENGRLKREIVRREN